MEILHIDTELTWRGGQAQIYYMLEQFSSEPNHFSHHLISPHQSPLNNKIKSIRNHSFTSKNIFKRVWSIIKIIRQHQIKLLHAHSSKGHTIAWIVCMFIRIPLIVTKRTEKKIHNNYFSRKKYLDANHIIAISSAVKLNLLKSGLTKEKISIVPDSVSLHLLDKKIDPLKIIPFNTKKNKPFIVGFAGALTPEKGSDVLIEAAKITRDENIKYMIAGEGPLCDHLKNLITNYHLQEKVYLLGFINDVGSFLKSIDLFVLPSKSEGLGSVLLQAMTAKKPIIASNIGGIPDLIKNQITGVLVPVGDSESIAKSIVRLKNNPKIKMQYADNAFKYVERFYTSFCAPKIISIYDAIIS